MTRQILVGGVPIGGGAPVVIQSMLNTKTTDVELTLQNLLNNMTDIDASGLTMSADVETIDFRVTAAAKEEGLKRPVKRAGA